jgi:hypothetical protein
MKKISLIACLFAITAMAMGQSLGNMILDVKKGDREKTISVYLANLQKKGTDISIMGMDGKTSYSEYIIGNVRDAAMNINLSAMKPGDYILKATNGEEKGYEVFFLTEDDVIFASNAANISSHNARFGATPYSKLIACFTIEEGTTSMRVQLSNLMHQPARVKFFNWQGECIYQEKIAKVIGYHTTFDMKEMGNGLYFVYVDASEAKVFQVIEYYNNTIKLGPTMGKERMLIEKTRPAVAAKW